MRISQLCSGIPDPLLDDYSEQPIKGVQEAILGRSTIDQLSVEGLGSKFQKTPSLADRAKVITKYPAINIDYMKRKIDAFFRSNRFTTTLLMLDVVSHLAIIASTIKELRRLRTDDAN